MDSNFYKQRIESMEERHRLMKYANRYMNNTNFDTIMQGLDFRLFFYRGEFQSYQEIDYYFKPPNSKDKKNN